jgi:hypothetical protein
MIESYPTQNQFIISSDFAYDVGLITGNEVKEYKRRLFLFAS